MSHIPKKRVKSRKTIGNMIAELEEQLEACREADKKLYLFKLLYESVDEKKQRKMTKDLLVSLGFSKKDISKMMTPPKPHKKKKI